MLNKNEKIELTIIDITFDGLGVGKYSDAEVSNFTVFVKNALIGDVIDCHIVKVLAHHAFGIIEKIIVPSVDRITPACKSFPKCGGCTFQNLSYQAELEYKKKNVIAAFNANYRKEYPQVDNTVPSPSITGYRNKVQYPISADGTFGFYAKKSHRTENVDGCILQPELFGEILTITEEFIKKYNISVYNEVTGTGLIRHLYLRQAPNTNETLVCIVINGKDLPHKQQLVSELIKIKEISSIILNINMQKTNVVLGRECRLLWGYDYITDELCGLKLRISPLSFYQINSKQAENIYKFAGEIAEITDKDVLLDLYCGTGTIGLSLAKRVKKIIGIEIIKSAIDNAIFNAEQNNISNAEFYCGDASDSIDIISKLDDQSKPSIIIVDPPRKGLDEKTINTINTLLPEKLIYISCNPATQARDIALINNDNSYFINSITPFDMFPRTSHVETVILMSRIEKEI